MVPFLLRSIIPIISYFHPFGLLCSQEKKTRVDSVIFLDVVCHALIRALAT
jgi:hypothetical protein